MSTTARRPGRVQRIAFDGTPLNSSKPDIDARIGWLLAMSRLHHADATFKDGRQFAAALADVGCRASRSLISRWESGEIPISYEGMSAYEAALDLESGRISSLTGYIRAAIPGVKAKVVRPHLDVASRGFALRLDELLDLAEDKAAVARDWQELGWHLAAVPLVHLRGKTWEAIAHQIVNLLPLSIRVPYRQYSTAAMNIASIPRAQDFLVDAIAHYLSDPDAQVLMNPLGLLDQLPTRAAARIVLDIIDHPPTDAVFRMAVWLATQKVARGDFTSEERTRLDMIVLRLWRANPAKTGDDLAELIAGLPEGLRSTFTNAATKAGRRKLGYVVEHGEELVASKARTMSHEIAESARIRVPQTADYDEDKMLPRLIREGLFHRDSERRHLAALLVSASPFGDAVADELLGLLDLAETPGWVRARAATMTRYLSNDSHRMRMLKFLNDADLKVAVPIAQAFGHLTFTEFSDQAIRSSLKEQFSVAERAKFYALGMTGSPGLEVIRRSHPAPEWQKSAARWWIAQGPAIRS
jgi:hypothetical protein